VLICSKIDVGTVVLQILVKSLPDRQVVIAKKESVVVVK